MTGAKQISIEEIDRAYERIKKDAQGGGYNLNPDAAFCKDLIRGLLENEARYGYMACPCRLASGKKENDLDIICPCDYRDSDLRDYDACYCALYVSDKVVKGEKQARSIPERRPPPGKKGETRGKSSGNLSNLPYPVWRCKVCGYLCAREEPPETCPVCKVKKDRFERFA